MAAPDRHELAVRLDAPLPSELAVGAGTALFISGTCFHRDLRVAALSLLVDGSEQPLSAHGMPRLDLFRSLHPAIEPFSVQPGQRDPGSDEDPQLHSYRSGFWGTARVSAGPATDCRLELLARLQDASQVIVPLATIPRVAVQRAGRRHPPAPDEGPLVAICMATYEPPPSLLRQQIESIQAQSHGNWICVISDDNSSPRDYAELRDLVADDSRFLVSRSLRRLGFYGNFERALQMAPANADYIALADQDDRWYPDKLSRLLDEIGDAELIYSDAHIVDAQGQTRADSYWLTRRNNHSDLLSVLVANSVTGAASLLRAEVLDDALPFPPAQFAHFHDHWLGLVALARGQIKFIDAPLYDYVQHGQAALGHARANRMVSLRSRLGALRGDPRERVRRWRLHYFVDVARLTQEATILELRLGDRMTPAKRRALRRFLDAETSLPALAGLWARGARELVGRPETLGAEWMLAYAYTWRRLLAASARERPQRRLRLDAVPPPDLVMPPGVEGADNPAVREIAAKVQPLALAISDQAPRRVNLLIPTIDLGHFFGGYIGKFNLARRLAQAGHRVRIVTVDPVGPLPADWRSQIEAYDGLDGIFAEVETAFGREAHGLEVGREDTFIATTWWTAHIARAALAELAREGFLYLIQEYEPFTFPMGTYAALAAESYTFPHTALFSTDSLRDYFRRHAAGVFAAGDEQGLESSAAFENAITAVAPPSPAELAARGTRRLLFYARPEAHASRNLFELGILALTRAVAEGALHGWELHGIGTTGGQRTISLGSGAELSLLPRAGQEAYAELLTDHDVGLALMYTPHPSLVPIEMAAAGLLTVTNSFENKTDSAMRAISPNLRAAFPSVTAVAQALTECTAAAGDYQARVDGAAVRWSRSWEESFPAALLAEVARLLED